MAADSNIDSRTSLIRKNIVASFLIKGWSALVQFLLVPLTLACLGEYENGVWLTISSVLLWINLFDVGLGNGLRNKLAAYMAVGKVEKARESVSSTLAMLVLLIVPVLLLLLVIFSCADVYGLFNVDRQRIPGLDTILAVTTFLVCATFVFKVIGNFYMGLQLPAVNNLLICLGSTFVLLATYLVLLSGVHSMLLIAVVNTAAPLIVYVSAYPVTFYRKYRHLRPSYKYVRISAVRELCSIGVQFFVLQIFGIVLLFSTNLIISSLFSPEMVTPYQIAYRYIFIAQTAFTVICGPYWTATTDAYERKDSVWLEKSRRTLDRYMCLLVIVIVFMVAVSGIVYDVWIGGRAEVPFSMTVLVGIYGIILICSSRYSFVLNGVGALRLQLMTTATAAILYIPSILLVVDFFPSVNSLLITMCLINLPGLVINMIQHDKIMKGTASGIWLK